MDTELFVDSVISMIMQCWHSAGSENVRALISTQLFHLMRQSYSSHTQEKSMDMLQQLGVTQSLNNTRETRQCMKSILMPAALHRYLRRTALGAAGYIRRNPRTKSNHLLHNGAAKTCQHSGPIFISVLPVDH
ncbi:hypothetical protein JOB18_034753 [Solea senegalensis]|uniref:Uncharacterized protein n=1 Tax=Solea senegalensis TaxID=28829 RepID=A0AAV6S4G6_SOLSE|nr:hypothetical protein JOB18_034753 [Solea senegalensis]